MIGFRYPISTSGSCTSSLIFFSWAKSFFTVIPFFRATVPALWITGPSANGSLKGIPTSIISIPLRSIALITSPVPSKVGHPAQKYKLKSLRSLLFANNAFILFIFFTFLFFYLFTFLPLKGIP
ncbi:Uncharacterised protein [Segatella copri]|nr:Uncharacterised protein [Segatella copri]